VSEGGEKINKKRTFKNQEIRIQKLNKNKATNDDKRRRRRRMAPTIDRHVKSLTINTRKREKKKENPKKTAGP